ncbi:MAG: hypothetical protein FWG06_00620 [Clostridiales bacterium]|nr:hypothetical protein [Clostridiales bacterium]
MKVYKIAAAGFGAIGLVLSYVMCARVAFEYCNMLWGIEYRGYSAPANTAFLLAIPYLFMIIFSFAVALILWKKHS